MASQLHAHPLTRLEKPNTPSGVTSCSACAVNISTTTFNCSGCQYDLCRDCNTRLTGQASHPHSHSLTHLDKPAYANGSYICDICRLSFNSANYHCNICSYDNCLDCYTKAIGPDENVIAKWLFNGTLREAYGNYQGAIVKGAEAYGKDGPRPYLKLDGKAVANVRTFPLQNISHTISLWFLIEKSDNQDINYQIFRGEEPVGFYVSVNLNRKYFYYGVYVEGNDNPFPVSAPFPAQLNTWYNVIATYNKKSASISISINGELKNTTSISSSGPVVLKTSSKFAIGYEANTSALYRLANLVVYHKALSTEAAAKTETPPVPGVSTVEFTIPKGASPVGFTVTTGIAKNEKSNTQKAIVSLDGTNVIKWEGDALDGINQVEQLSKDRDVERKCKVEIQNNKGGSWKPSATKYMKFTTPASDTTQGYVLHVVYSEMDNPAPDHSDFDDCVIHAMYLLDSPATKPVIPTIDPNAKPEECASTLADALVKGSPAVKEQAAQLFLQLVEQGGTNAFTSPQVVISVIDSATTGNDRTKGTVMFAVGKITMNCPGMSTAIEDKLSTAIKLLHSDNPNVVQTAVEALWMFSFDPTLAQKLKEPEVVAQLQKLTESTDPTLSKLARGVLFQLGCLKIVTVGCSSPCPHCVICHPHLATPAPGPSQPAAPPSTVTPAPVQPAPGTEASAPTPPPPTTVVAPTPTLSNLTSGKYIMLSYNWGSQTMVKKVKNALDQSGYHCWIDIERMQGSTLEAMALAVENAGLILVCFTKKYKESAACRTEAEYAYTLKKPIIPLKMDQTYNADGWLGALLGTKLYYEFYPDSDFTDTVGRLMGELGSRGK